jgi:hypothetical protein
MTTAAATPMPANRNLRISETSKRIHISGDGDAEHGQRVPADDRKGVVNQLVRLYNESQ